MKSGSWQASVLYGVSIFCSAFLLFWIQLFFGKMLLPALGGSPSVWATCLVFFQTVLALGYFLAHWVSQRLSLKSQVIFQASLMAVALLFLPIRLIEWNGYPRTDQPLLSTLVVLAVSVGVPFLALSGISPLLQNWFRDLQVARSKDVYVFYSASNLGSLGSLALYPFEIEPRFGISIQGQLWTAFYIAVSVLVILCGVLAILRSQVLTSHLPVLPANSVESLSPSVGQRMGWLILAAVPSSLLSGSSTYAAVQVAPFPLLWAIFLGLYLFTFVLVFAPRPQYLPDDLVAILPYAVAVSFGIKFLRFDSLSLTAMFVVFFFVAWACHSRLAQQRPEAAHLTQFYLFLALGGALGGFFNAIVAPLLFKTYFEYDLVLVISIFALPVLSTARLNLVKNFGMMMAVVLFVSTLKTAPFYGEVTYQARSFFGAYQIIRSYNGKMLMLVHGNTAHGFQFLDQRRGQPTGYYTRTSPIGDIFRILPQKKNLQIAIAGLGNGGLSAYAQPGQTWDYYEIDPLMLSIAQTQFDYLKLSKVRPTVEIGDARLSLEKSGKKYDLILLDAFTSDSIPQHLITHEAVQLYLDHLLPDGVLAFHISNRYLDFEPVLGKIGNYLGLTTFKREDVLASSTEADEGKFSSTWISMARTPERLAALKDTWVVAKVGNILWSDDSTPVYTALKSRN